MFIGYIYVCNPSLSLSCWWKLGKIFSTRIANLIMHIFYTLLHALSTLHRLQSEHEADFTCGRTYRPLPSTHYRLPLHCFIVVAFVHFVVERVSR